MTINVMPTEVYKVLTRFCKMKTSTAVLKTSMKLNFNPSATIHTSKLKLTDNLREILSGGGLEELAVGCLELCNIAIYKSKKDIRDDEVCVIINNMDDQLATSNEIQVIHIRK